MTKESTDDGGHYYAQLSEIKLFRTPIQSCREEYPAGAVASSTESAGHSAENVLDDEIWTIWSSKAYTSENVNEWIYVDMNSTTKIRGFVMDGQWSEVFTYFPQDFKLQYSNNAVTWTDIPGQSHTGYLDKPENNKNFGRFIFSNYVNARYIRLHITRTTGNDGVYRVQLSKIRIISEADYSSLPVEFHRENVSSASASSEDGVHTASCVIDNNDGTFWSTGIDNDGIVGEWISVDLGSDKSVGCVSLKPRMVSGQPVYFPLDFKFQYSLDGNTWLDVPGQSHVNYSTSENADKEDFVFTLPVKARYIRLYITRESIYDGKYYAQLQEFKVYSTPPTQYTIESPASATASSIAYHEFIAPYAIDGNTVSCWSSQIDSDGLVNEWLCVDLGSGNSKNIACIALKPRNLNGVSVYFPKDFKFQYSNDAVTWEDVYGQSYTDYEVIGGTDDQVFPFSIPVKARYFRVYITRASMYDDCYYAQIAEFKLYSKNMQEAVQIRSSSSLFTPGNAIDYIYSTYWSSPLCPGGNTHLWVQADVGLVKTISCIALAPRREGSSPLHFPVDFKLQYSKDRVNWTDIPGQTYVNYSVGEEVEDQVFTFSSPVQARYIRVYITKESDDGAGHYYAQFAEFKVYSCDTERIEIAPNPRIQTTVYPTEDIVVADYVVTDPAYGADPTGVNDSTAAIQQAIDDCYYYGGGTVWLPAGKYKVTGTLYVKAFVTLRGDWRDPDTGSGSYGTVILAEVAQGLNGPVVFDMSGDSAVDGITVYYPGQSNTNPQPYNYTFRILGYGTVLDWACFMIQNVTLLNSYMGIGAAPDSYSNHEHQSLYVRNVKGTVLYRGLVINNNSNIDSFRNITFNNSYWANAAGYNPPNLQTINAWTRANGIGLVVSALEFTPFYKLDFDSYKYGIHMVDHPRIDSAATFLYCTIRNTDIAVKADVQDYRWGSGFLRCTLEGSSYAVENTSQGYIKLCDCNTSGAITGDVRVYTPGTSLLSYPDKNSSNISRAVLYDAVGEYGAPYVHPEDDRLPEQDAAPAIQEAIDAAASEGGGIVYLRAGWYRLDGHLTVPSNVELRGCSPAARDNWYMSRGTVLFCYEGRNTANPETATAAVTIGTNSGAAAGIRSVRFYYPEANPFDYDGVNPYPYSIRLNGDNIYVVDIGFLNSYNAIDGGTYVCNNHFIRNIHGTVFKKVVRVRLDGDNEGRVENVFVDYAMAVRTQFWHKDVWLGGSPANERGLITMRDYCVPLEAMGTDTSREYALAVGGYGINTGIHAISGNVYAYNVITDNLKGSSVSVDSGANVAVMSMMMYGGPATIGTAQVYNRMYLRDEPNPILMPNQQGDVLVFTATTSADPDTNNKFLYMKAANISRTWQEGDCIEYDVRVDSNVALAEKEIGGIDICNTDGSYVRDLPLWADQCGVAGHPSGDLSAYAVDMWYHRKLPVPAEIIGKTGSWLDVVFEANLADTTYTAWYDNIVITNGGVVQEVLYSSGAPTLNAVDFKDMYSGQSLTFARLNAFECENRTVSMSPGDSHAATENPNMSCNYGDYFNSNGAGDYIEYTVVIPEAGTYNIEYRTNKSNNKGIYQLMVDGSNRGTAQDLYSASDTYDTINPGTVTFDTAGARKFRFICTGKNAGSLDYDLFIDYILLTKQ